MGKPIAVYAGSFDPLTNGHLWMIRAGATMFPKLVVAIGVNPAKKPGFTLDERLAMLRQATRGIRNVTIDSFGDQFLISYARQVGATHIMRGIRSATDYDYERTMRNINEDLCPAITTVFLMPPRSIAEVSSSMVKGLIGPKGWERIVKGYVPETVFKQLLKKHG